MAETWIAFLDLLGTKNSSKIKKSEYPNRINMFARTIREQSQDLNANIKIRFFSDSAYIECDNPEQMFILSKRLRHLLFSQGIFFKSALTKGHLSDETHSENTENRHGKKIDIQGASFGEKAVGVYYNQENFKGLGFFIESTHNPDSFPTHLCKSAFPVSDDLKTWRAFVDINYIGTGLEKLILSTSELDDHENSLSLLDILLENALKASYQKRGLSRYYISTFISIVNSSDFSKADFKNNEWENIPPIFHHIVNSSNRNKNYKSLHGGSAIYLALVNRFFSVEAPGTRSPRYLDASTSGLCDRFLDEIFDTKLASSIQTRYPETIIDGDVLDGLIHRMVALRMRR